MRAVAAPNSAPRALSSAVPLAAILLTIPPREGVAGPACRGRKLRSALLVTPCAVFLTPTTCNPKMPSRLLFHREETRLDEIR